ncbi:MAG: tetratricopeptide repeat protein [Elusimicrobia bacterium]|nr:tetratricopeptide repeat protein [Elusimicrobiota bacterium]
MPSKVDPLDLLFAEESETLPAYLFRGYISHALLFYRQNDLKGFRELIRLGRELELGPGGDPGRSSSLVESSPGWPEALQAIRQHDEKKALAGLASAIRKNPKEPAFYVLRGFVRGEPHWGSRRLSEESIADFEKALSLDPDQLWARMGLGMALEMRRRFTRALAQFDAASVLAPGWSWPKVFRGVCQWYLAEPRQATASFALAAALDPDSDLPLLFMARSKADYRDRSLVPDLDRALELAPESGFALSWRGRAMFILQRRPQALSDLKRSIKALPDYDRGWSWLGVSLCEQGKFKAAVPLLLKARKLNPYYPTTLYPLAGALMRVGRWDAGGRVMRESAAVDRSGVWVEHRISMSHPNPACLRSRADLDRYIAHRPKSAWAWAWRGQTELLLQNYAKALADLDRALALDPEDAWARLWRGEALRRVGDFAGARAELDRALRLDKSLSWAYAAKGDCLLAAGRRALLALGRAAEAARAFGHSLELHPQDRWVARLRALSLALAGDWAGALAGFDGVGHSDDDAALRAYLLARAGRAAESRAAAAEALRRNADHPLARAVRAGRLPDAGAALSSLAQSDPASAYEPRVLAEAAARAGLSPCARALKKGDLAAALRAAQEERPRRDAGLYRLRGWLKLATGDAAGAIEEASRALDATLDPSDRAALWLRRRAWAALGDRPLMEAA